MPFTAATVGLSSSQSSRMKAWTPVRNASAVVRGSNPGLPACATVDAVRSMPAQNASPVAVMRNARTAGSVRPVRSVSVIVSRISGVSVCLASGRSSVIRHTPSASVSTRTVIDGSLSAWFVRMFTTLTPEPRPPTLCWSAYPLRIAT